MSDATPETDVDGTDAVGAEDQVIEIDFDALDEPVQQLITSLEAERDEAIGARQRALADYANFQRRAAENETRARLEGRGGVVRSLIPALDHFDLALQQNADETTVEAFMNGVKMVRSELTRIMENQGVSEIRPEVGEEFDPNRHQAMMQQPTAEHDPGSVVMVMQNGYAQGDVVLRPASVAVSVAPTEDD